MKEKTLQELQEDLLRRLYSKTIDLLETADDEKAHEVLKNTAGMFCMSLQRRGAE